VNFEIPAHEYCPELFGEAGPFHRVLSTRRRHRYQHGAGEAHFGAGQPIIVDNRSDAAGAVGTEVVGKRADGYTTLFTL